jgi:hypothetical protein
LRLDLALLAAEEAAAADDDADLFMVDVFILILF